ncbi:MAG: DNA-3-methyladenine glycosylase [Actinomycetota bacterium]
MTGPVRPPDGRLPEAVADRRWLARPALEVAPDLLGCVLVRAAPEGAVGVRLTEVEAYEGLDDPGSHAFRGRTARSEIMFGPPGHLYVYFSYGMHWCANLVCGEDGRAAAVLLRAGEVVAGLELARTRRPSVRADRDLARGPARLARCLGLTGAENGVDLVRDGSPVWLARSAERVPADRMRSGPRVGLSRAADRPWRFWLDGEPTVSRYRPHARRR